MDRRFGFHYQGQFVEAVTNGGLIVKMVVDGQELQPEPNLLRYATAQLRRLMPPKETP